MKYNRFIDRNHHIDKESGFIKREYGMSTLWLAGAYVVTFAAIVLWYHFAPGAPAYLNALVIGLIFLGFAYLNITLIQNHRAIIDVLELQNALFAGAAKLATDFCIILKHDGSVVYVDPRFSTKFFHLKSKGLDDFDALCESGSLTKKSQKKLLNALKNDQSDYIEFKLPASERKSKFLALNVDPISILSPKELGRTVHLAVQPIDRPSGYFFLRAQKFSAEDEYKECLNSFDLGYYCLNENNLFESVNRIFCQITGYEKQELLTGTVPLDSIIGQEDVASQLKQNKAVQCVTHIVTHNAQTLTVLITQSPVKNTLTGTTKKHGAIHVIAQQISEDLPQPHTPSEYNINPEINIDIDLLQQSPIATTLMQPNGKIIKKNQAFNNFTQQLSDQSKITNIYDIIEDDFEQEIKEHCEGLIQTPSEKPSTPISLDLKGKEERSASLYLNRLSNQVIIGQLIDTTNLKNLELKFAHSQKMQAVGQLAGGIAHDFNNLLTAMTGFCDLLLIKHPAGDASFPDIMQIKQNANRAANLVKQLLAFSRKQTLQPEIIDITDALADLSNLIRRLIGENLSLKMIHGKDLKHIKVDRSQFEQVIINLAVNARDAMPDGGELAIETSNITIDSDRKQITSDMILPTVDEHIEPGEYIRITICDTGTGISKKIMNKIFDPFFSTKEMGSGTGLGLSTVYGIVKQTNGYIYISTKINKGTCFSIFLKTSKQPIPTKAPHPSDQAGGEHELGQTIDLTGQGNILLVEDETPVRIFSSNALSNKGYRVFEADCAESALEIMNQQGDLIDLIVTDVVMPGMNGPTMIEEINKTYPDIKVIFVSGYGEDEFVKNYGQERTFNFLSKPFTLKQLAARVKDVIVETEKS